MGKENKETSIPAQSIAVAPPYMTALECKAGCAGCILRKDLPRRGVVSRRGAGPAVAELAVNLAGS
ncbi:MAG: hypothetical protein ABSC61_09120 [Anaerolineales bacterium]